MLYDPVRARQAAVEGGLARVLGTQHDPKLPMGNFGRAALSDVISAWLVGLHAEIAPAIPRSLQWIDKAVAEDEKFGVDPNEHRTALHWAKAIGGWLDGGSNHEGEWDFARVYEEARWRYEQRPWPASEIVKSGLDDYMAFAFQGGEHDDGFEAGIGMYERWTGKTGVSLSGTLKRANWDTRCVFTGRPGATSTRRTCSRRDAKCFKPTCRKSGSGAGNSFEPPHG